MRRELEEDLKELRLRISKFLPDGTTVDIESIKPGDKRMYRLVLKTEKNGAITDTITAFADYKTIKTTLQALIKTLRIIS